MNGLNYAESRTLRQGFGPCRWHHWRDIFSLANLLVMTRPDDRENYPAVLELELSGRWVDSVSRLMSQPAGSVMKTAVTGLSISSSDIREMLRTGVSPRFLLPDEVLHYIRKHGLYG